MSNPCRICSNPRWADQVGDWAREGVSDREVARRLGIDKSLVTRHRARHILTPLRHQLAIADKAAEPQRQRQRLAAAATGDTPTPAEFAEAFFGLKAQAEKLERIESRLERMAVAAESAGSPTGVAQLAAQQYRGIETGAKLANLPGFIAPAHTAAPAERARFSITMVFPNAGRTESMTFTSAPALAGADAPTHLEIEGHAEGDRIDGAEDGGTAGDA